MNKKTKIKIYGILLLVCQLLFWGIPYIEAVLLPGDWLVKVNGHTAYWWCDPLLMFMGFFWMIVGMAGSVSTLIGLTWECSIAIGIRLAVKDGTN